MNITDNLDIYPGQVKIIQFLNPDKTPYVIPPGSTIAARAVSKLKTVVADLSPSITDASKGLVSITLPDNTLVKRHAHKAVFFDIAITLLGGAKKYLPLSEMNIIYSMGFEVGRIPGAIAI